MAALAAASLASSKVSFWGDGDADTDGVAVLDLLGVTADGVGAGSDSSEEHPPNSPKKAIAIAAIKDENLTMR